MKFDYFVIFVIHSCAGRLDYKKKKKNEIICLFINIIHPTKAQKNVCFGLRKENIALFSALLIATFTFHH